MQYLSKAGRPKIKAYLEKIEPQNNSSDNDNDDYDFSIDEFLDREDDMDSFYVYKVIENNPVEDLKKIDGEKLISFWVKLHDFVISNNTLGTRATDPYSKSKANLEVQNFLKIIEYFQKELLPLFPYEVGKLIVDIDDMEKFKKEKVDAPGSKLEDYINELKQRERSLDPRVYEFIDSLDINFDSDKMRFLFKNKEGQMQETSKESVLKIVEYYRKNLGRHFIKVPDAGFFDNGDPDYFDTNYYGNAIKFLLLEGPLDSVGKIEFFKQYIASPSIFTTGHYRQKDLEKFIEILKELRATDKWNKVPTDIKENIDKTINAYGYNDGSDKYDKTSGCSDIDVMIAYLNECNRLYEFYRDTKIEGAPIDFHEEILMDFVTGRGSNRSIINDDFLAKLKIDKKGRFYIRNHTTKKRQIISEKKLLEFLNLYNEFRDYFAPYIPLNVDNPEEILKAILFSTPEAIDQASEEKHTAVSSALSNIIEYNEFPEYIITATKHFKAADDKYNSEKFNSFQYEACPKGMTDELGPPAQKLINLLIKLFRLKGIYEFSDAGQEVYRDEVTEMLFNELNETTRKNIITDCKYFNKYIDKSGKKLNGWLTDYPMDNLNIIKFICEISENAE